MSNEFQCCSREESEYWESRQNPEFGFLGLSKTYIDEDITQLKRTCPGIKLERSGDSGFDCVMTNMGEGAWSYSNDLPSIEVWNQGTWLEVKSLFDSNLALANIAPGETAEFRFA